MPLAIPLSAMPVVVLVVLAMAVVLVVELVVVWLALVVWADQVLGPVVVLAVVCPAPWASHIVVLCVVFCGVVVSTQMTLPVQWR